MIHGTPQGLPQADNGIDGRDINLVADVFLHERAARRTIRVTRPSAGLRWLDPSHTPVISGNGRVVAFLSRQPVSGDDDRETFDLFIAGLGVDGEP